MKPMKPNVSGKVGLSVSYEVLRSSIAMSLPAAAINTIIYAFNQGYLSTVKVKETRLELFREVILRMVRVDLSCNSSFK